MGPQGNEPPYMNQRTESENEIGEISEVAKEEKDKREKVPSENENEKRDGIPEVHEESHDAEEYRLDALLENGINALSDIHQVQYGDLLSQPLDNILRMAEDADSRRGIVVLDDKSENEGEDPIEEIEKEPIDINFNLDGLLPPEPVEQEPQQSMEVPYQAPTFKYYHCFCYQCEEALMVAGYLDMPYNYYNLIPVDIAVKAANEALERITILRAQREGWPEDSRRARRIWNEFCKERNGTLEFNEESEEEIAKSIDQREAEKSDRVKKQREEDKNSAGKTYSRSCAICWNDNPAKRAVLVKCGHVLCLACADQSTEVTSKRMRCPVCNAITRIVPFIESVYEEEQKRTTANQETDGQVEEKKKQSSDMEQEAQNHHEVDQPNDNHPQSSPDVIFKRPYDVPPKDDEVTQSKIMRTE